MPTIAEENSSNDHIAKNKWLICLIMSLFPFYEFIQINMYNSIGEAVMQTFDFTEVRLGLLSATYLFGNIIFLIPAGICLDRFNTRKIILTVFGITVLSTLCFSLSPNAIVLFISSFIGGSAGGAFCVLSAIRMTAQWFSLKQMALAIGVLITISNIGAIFAQTPLLLLTEQYGWRIAVLIYSLLGIIFWLLIWRYIQVNPKSKFNHFFNLRIFLSSIPTLMKNVQNWMLAIYVGLLNLSVILLGAIWGLSYLSNVKSLSYLHSSYITSSIFVGMIVGAPLNGWFSDFLQTRKTPMVLGAILSTITLIAIMHPAITNTSILLVLFFFLGYFVSSQIIAYPAMIENNEKHVASTATSLISLLLISLGVLFQPIFGWIISNDQIHAFGFIMNPYQIAMLILPISSSIALLLALLMKDTYYPGR